MRAPTNPQTCISLKETPKYRMPLRRILPNPMRRPLENYPASVPIRFQMRLLTNDASQFHTENVRKQWDSMETG